MMHIYIVSCLVAALLFSSSSFSNAQPEKKVMRLADLLEEAVQRNPEILAARKRLEALRARVSQASSLEDPMLGLGIISVPTNFNLRDEDMTMKEISISQKIPFPGKRPLMREMAEKEAEAGAADVQAKIHQVTREVKAVYYELSHVYRAEAVIQRNKKILEDFAKITETRYSVGEGIQQDVIKAHVEVAKMVDEGIILGQKKKALEAKLMALLNRPPEEPVAAPEEVVFRKLPFRLEEIQVMALEMNPTIKRMRKMIEAKEKSLALAKRDYYPDFNFRLAYGQRDRGPEGGRRDLLTGMVEVNIPIFFRSKQDQKVLEARADIQSLEAQYRAMKNEVLYMVAEIFSMIQRGEKQIELYRTGILPQAAIQVESSLSAYRVNRADFMTLLDSQLTLYRYELEYHQALTEHEKNIASLAALTGRESFERGEGK